MGKFGRPNHVKIDPLAYNICLLGESKVGKTTLIREVCEQLVGNDGYMFLECGQERGADAIEGITYVNCPEWQMDYDEATNSAGFEDVCDDIIDNKTTEYADLKVVIIDTYDQLIDMAEIEAIRLWNKENPDKRTSSINAAWGGFGKGDKKAIELMFNKIAELRNVGVSTIIIGHIKTKNVTDPVTGETYQTLTSDQQQNYFNALKKNLHFLGLAYIDRQIVKEKTGKKNIVTGKEESVNKVKGEARKIKFRDDNFCVDSGSRFAQIVEEIDLDAGQFIQALTDAIKAEQSKSGKSFEESKAEQEKAEAENLKQIAKNEENKRNAKALENVISEITAFIKDNKSNLDVLKPILAAVKEMGYDNPTKIDNLEDANKVLKMIK